MYKTKIEALRAAHDLIADPARWTTRAYARDESGIPINATSERARCWCALGALQKVYGDGKGAMIVEAWNLLDAQSPEDVGGYNDSHSHSEVLALFDAAIAVAGAEA